MMGLANTYYRLGRYAEAEALFLRTYEGRRRLLGALLDRDGQTLKELCDVLPDMTRPGVMNHLKVLEEGGLVATAKVGRERHHYLNPVPIQLIHDRWLDKFTAPEVRALARMTAGLDDPTFDEGAPMTAPDHIHETYIRCTPDAAWQAIVDGEKTAKYFYGTRIECDLEAGAPMRYLDAEGSVVADGEIVAVEPGHRLEMMFHPRWSPELDAAGAVRTAWIVEETMGLTKVRVEYYDLRSPTREEFEGGIPFIVAGMKTLLETGAPITA